MDSIYCANAIFEGQMQINSKEWLDYRKGGIGSSDAPIILGLSDYKTPYQLWLEKIGSAPESAGNFVTDLGHKFEPYVREDLNLKKDLNLSAAIAQHSEHPWLRATLDGLDEENKVFCEIKMMGKASFDTVVRESKPHKSHYAQMMHQYLVTGYEHAFYSAYYLNTEFNKIEEIYHRPVFRCDHFIKKYFEKAEEFWGYVETKTPPPLSDRDYLLIESEEAKCFAEEFVKAKTVFDKTKKELEFYKAKLLSLSNHPRVQVGNVLIKKGKANTITIRGDKDV